MILEKIWLNWGPPEQRETRLTTLELVIKREAMFYIMLMLVCWVFVLWAIATLIKNKKWKGLIGFILLFIGILNISPVVPVYLGIGGILEHYYYATEDRQFEFTEISGKRGLDVMQRSFNDFQSENPSTQDTTIYRTFRLNPLKVWKWREYLTHPRWDYPYKPIGEKETGKMYK